MPDYLYVVDFIDVKNGETSKRYTGTFADFTAARAAADALLVDVQALTGAHTIKDSLTEFNVIAGAPAGDSNVFERISATLDLSGGKKANHQFPSPVAASMSGNALDIASAQWTNYIDNFISGGWTVSDGETPIATISGKRIFVRSGTTNLPV